MARLCVPARVGGCQAVAKHPSASAHGSGLPLCARHGLLAPGSGDKLTVVAPSAPRLCACLSSLAVRWAGEGQSSCAVGSQKVLLSRSWLSENGGSQSAETRAVLENTGLLNQTIFCCHHTS